ncbi:hypothetical protein ES703_04085 [subsurface metagenome]
MKVSAVMILDVIGKPPEHLVESLEKIIENMGKEQGVILKSKQIKEPTLMKEQKDFYTTFAEVEIEVDEILYLAILMFKYMPAHIEIISPEILALSNNGFNDILNELTRRLHGYDEIARIMQIEKQILLNKIQELGGEIPAQVMPIQAPPQTQDNQENLEKPKTEKKQKKKPAKKKSKKSKKRR